MLWSYPGPLQTQFLHAGIQFYWQWSTQQSLYGCLNARVPDHEMRCQQAHFRSSPNVCEQLREVMDMESVWTHLACAMHGIYQGLRKEAWEIHIDASCQNSVVCFLSCKCIFMLYMSLTALSLQTKSLSYMFMLYMLLLLYRPMTPNVMRLMFLYDQWQKTIILQAMGRKG